MELTSLFESFVQHGKFLKNWSPKTIESYRLSLSSFQQSRQQVTSPGLAPGSTEGILSKAQLEAWVVAMRTRGLTPGGCNVRIRAINSFLSWLHENEHLPQKLRLKLLTAQRPVIAPFSDSDIRLLLSYKPQGFYELRTWTLVNVLLDTGCRIDEVLTLRTDGVDLENLVLTVMGKGRKPRRVPFSLELRKSLFRYLQVRGRKVRGVYVFGTSAGTAMRYRNIYQDIFDMCEGLGIKGPRVSPHTLRHFFSVSYIRNGGNIYNLSRILGHTSVRTTEIYLQTMGVDQVGEEHSNLSPLGRLSVHR